MSIFSVILKQLGTNLKYGMAFMYFANGLQSLHAVPLLQSSHTNEIKTKQLLGFWFIRLLIKLQKHKDLGSILSAEESSVKLQLYEK